MKVACSGVVSQE